MAEKAKDPSLYAQAVAFADATHARPSAYKSMAIQKKYMELYREKYGDGDAYKGKRKMSSLEKWRSEKWTDVESYLKGDPKPCGFTPDKPRKGLPACRPLKVLQQIPASVARKAVTLKRKETGTIDWEKMVEEYNKRRM
jgi:hypothetical protein